MSTHTPLPWTSNSRNIPIADTGDYDGIDEIIASNGKRIVEVWGDDEEDAANIKFIVLACNHHTAMLDLLKSLTENESRCRADSDGNCTTHGPGKLHGVECAVSLARKLIADVEGKK